MANLTEAEKIAHYWAKQTATAISWTWGLAFLVALFTHGFNVWSHFSEGGKEQKRREGADALDRDRRRRNDDKDEERRRRGEEEEKKRREKKEEEKARKREKKEKEKAEKRMEKEEEEAEREEAGRKAEERMTKAAKRLEKIIQDYRADHLKLYRELSAAKVDAAKVERLHRTQSQMKDWKIIDLQREIEE